MIKKIILATLVSIAPLAAKELIVTGQNNMVKTQLPQETNSVYLGSFLAQGHVAAKDIYRIDAPVEGVIERLNVNIYEPITKGELLAVIKSPKMLELESTYINILIEQEYNANEVARLKPLYEATVVPKKQYLRALNTLAKFQTQSEFYYHLLQQWGLSKDQVEKIKTTKQPAPDIKVYAPISGSINDLNIFPKMYLQRGEHMMTILDDNDAHLVVALPIGLAKRLKLNQKLYVGDKPVIVESIAAEIDSRTQTVAIHLLPEKSMHIMLNEKKNIKLYLPQHAYRLPSSAIIEYNDSQAVFVKVSTGYKLTEVSVLGRNNDSVYVISNGLNAQSAVAVNGVISLKGALQGQSDD